MQAYKRAGFDQIMTCIEIKDRMKESVIDTGGYSEIIRGLYSFIILASLYITNPSSIQNPQSNEGLLQRCVLVKKVSCQSDEVNVSHLNECRLLVAIRNKICPFVAKYYVPNSVVPFKEGEIFMEQYSMNLADSHLT